MLQTFESACELVEDRHQLSIGTHATGALVAKCLLRCFEGNTHIRRKTPTCMKHKSSVQGPVQTASSREGIAKGSMTAHVPARQGCSMLDGEHGGVVSFGILLLSLLHRGHGSRQGPTATDTAVGCLPCSLVAVGDVAVPSSRVPNEEAAVQLCSQNGRPHMSQCTRSPDRNPDPYSRPPPTRPAWQAPKKAPNLVAEQRLRNSQQRSRHPQVSVKTPRRPLGLVYMCPLALVRHQESGGGRQEEPLSSTAPGLTPALPCSTKKSHMPHSGLRRSSFWVAANTCAETPSCGRASRQRHGQSEGWARKEGGR